jgi:hypothetical protein
MVMPDVFYLFQRLSQGHYRVVGGCLEVRDITSRAHNRLLVLAGLCLGGALTGPSRRFLEALAEGRLARQKRYFRGLDPTVRTAHSIELDHHRGSVF